ncbi:dienelactone hydrolase-related enzyme [uncultured Jannaschia sp.]|uniref:RcgR family putative quorum lactone hydrolase n=1 Tax=uncultured Jannaschia sp. TaxID=293347 RepID=UPI00261F2C87|nr:dienelactone hydrolase-related enzyme [uncultured Jannaschia sp.]
MLHKWLDERDERRARRGDEDKKVTDLALDADLAFSAAQNVDSIAEFCAHADHAVANSVSFYGWDGDTSDVVWEDGWITFPSSLETDIVENNTVRAKVTQGRSSDHALVVFHHWNAPSRKPQLAQFFAWQGITVVEVAMPYHLERSRPGSSHADYMLSPNLGRTIQSMRQAVLDGRKIVGILNDAGYKKVSVLGMSLGSWVAGLVASHEPMIGKAVLLLTAGSLADMVWTGRATRHIRASLEGKVELSELRKAWAPLSLESYSGQLARSDLALQLVLAERDTVVLPQVSRQLIETLNRSGATPKVLNLDCGHYSLSLPPYILRAGFAGSRLLHRQI